MQPYTVQIRANFRYESFCIWFKITFDCVNKALIGTVLVMIYCVWQLTNLALTNDGDKKN